jgi:ribosome recycling factor
VRLLAARRTTRLKKLQKSGELSEDDARRATDDVQKRTDKYVAEIDTLCKHKEKELMEV